MNRSLSKKRISVEGLCAYSVRFNHAVVTVGWRSGKETTTNLVIQLRFHNLLRKQKAREYTSIGISISNPALCMLSTIGDLTDLLKTVQVWKAPGNGS